MKLLAAAFNRERGLPCHASVIPHGRLLRRPCRESSGSVGRRLPISSGQMRPRNGAPHERPVSRPHLQCCLCRPRRPGSGRLAAPLRSACSRPASRRHVSRRASMPAYSCHLPLISLVYFRRHIGRHVTSTLLVPPVERIGRLRRPSLCCTSFFETLVVARSVAPAWLFVPRGPSIREPVNTISHHHHGGTSSM